MLRRVPCECLLSKSDRYLRSCRALPLREFGCVGQKPVRRCAFPLWIAWRKVLANISHRNRAEDRVGQGMQADICVGMADEAVCVGDLYAAEPDMIAFAEPMHVIA